MSKNKRIYNKFEYHVEDLDCHYCLFYVRMNRITQTGCGEVSCRFQDIRREAIENNRIKRSRGWFKRCPE